MLKQASALLIAVLASQGQPPLVLKEPTEIGPQSHAQTARRVILPAGDVQAELLPAELYGAAYIGPDGVASLYRIDPSTAIASVIGSTGFQRISAMDFDASGRLLATAERNDGSNTSVLISINLATGAGTEIGPTGVTGTGFGNTLSDMSFRNADGVLYAYIEPSDGVGVIDPSTGSVTALGASGLSSAGNGIAFDAADTLFHADQARVNTVNQLTGAASPVTGLIWSPPADNAPRVNSLDFHPSSGVLYATVQDDFGGSESYLATVDPSGGTVTIIGAIVNGMDALAWRPARAVSTLPPLAPALYGSAYTGPDGLSTLYRLDPATGAAAFIGPIGFERVSAMDFDPYGTLYATGERADGSNTNVLLTIDVHTGRGTEVGPTNVLATGFGDVFSDIDFRRSDGRLYGYVEGGDGVAVIDPLTGTATALGPAAGPGCCGNGIAFDAAGSVLYHVSEAAVSTLDQTTGLATPIAPAVYLPPLAGSARANSLDAHPATGVLYASIRNGAPPFNWLGTVDPVSGRVIPIGPSVDGLDAVAWGGITCGVIDFEGIPESTMVGKIGGPVSVTFGPEWVSLVDSDAGGGGNFANEPSADTIVYHTSATTPIELGSGVRFVRLHMVAHPASVPITLTGWDRPGGAGNVVTSDLRATVGVAPPAPCTGDPTGGFCLWDALTLQSTTDDIRSLTLAGSLPGNVGYDELTYCAGPPDILYGAAYVGADGLATLHRIDPDTGAFIPVGPIGYQRVSAMDFDARGTLYATGERNDGSNTNVLLTINTATGAGTEIGPTGVMALGFGDTFTDMSFRNADNKLFAYIDTGDALGVIDTLSAAAGLVGPTGIGCCGNGIAFDPGDNLLHANDGSLNLLSQALGTGAVLAPLIWVPPADSFPRVNAMDFRPRSRVLYVSVQDGSAGSPENYLGILSLGTAAVEILGPTAVGLDSIAWLSSGRLPLPPEVSPIGAAIPLTVEAPSPAQLKIGWEPTFLADSYRVLIGDPAVLGAMGGVVPGNTTTMQCHVTGTTLVIPMPAGNVFIEVAADNATGTGPLGLAIPSMTRRQGDLTCP